MANKKQLKILETGVRNWNKWRKSNRNIKIDLRKAVLNEVDLSGVDLRNADLKGSQLVYADLSGAKLSHANLYEADLTGANFDNANLSEVDLRHAILQTANFSSANLVGAKLDSSDLRDSIFIDANISKANLSMANLDRAKFSDANLNRTCLDGASLIETDFARASLNGTSLVMAGFTFDKFDAIRSVDTELSRAYIKKINFRGASLTKSNLSVANLPDADFREANLDGANLDGASLMNADFSFSNLRFANLRTANLHHATFDMANLEGADLRNCRLRNSSFVGTDVHRVKISGSRIYGVNVWDLNGEFDEQRELEITNRGDQMVTVDNIEVAQFVYLILNNKRIRDVINTLTSKTVLILGRFSIPERKVILDALRNKLRDFDLLPIVFDFDRPTDKDFTETIKTLAGISYFVIADITNPKSSPLELQATVPDYQIPFVPIIQEGESPFAMMVDLQSKYPWVLPTKSYDSIETLMRALKPGIIDPAVKMRNKLRLVKAQEQQTESLRDYLKKSL